MQKQTEQSGENSEYSKKFESPKDKIEDKKTSVKITAKNAYRIAIKLLGDDDFKKILKEYIAEKIVRKELFTRMDKLVKLKNTKEYIETYGLTFKHFEDIENGNLSSFDLVEDDGMIAITFKRNSGHPSLRYIDEKILADILNDIFDSRPEFNKDLNLITK